MSNPFSSFFLLHSVAIKIRCFIIKHLILSFFFPKWSFYSSVYSSINDLAQLPNPHNESRKITATGRSWLYMRILILTAQRVNISNKRSHRALKSVLIWCSVILSSSFCSSLSTPQLLPLWALTLFRGVWVVSWLICFKCVNNHWTSFPVFQVPYQY